MQRYRHISSSARIVARNKLLTIAIVLLLVMQGWNFVTIERMMDAQRTIIHPIGVSTAYAMTGTSAGHIYLNAMAHYIADLLLNYHPETIETNIDHLLTLYREAEREAVLPYYRAIASQIIALGYSSAFYITDIAHTEDVMTISGIQRRQAAAIASAEEAQRYTVHYHIRHGRFEILELSRLPETVEGAP